MAIVMDTERKPGGVAADGRPVTTIEFRSAPRRPRSMAEWVEQRAAALGSPGRYTVAGRAVVALLEAGEDADVKAAGRTLEEVHRFSVGKTLEACRGQARSGYPPAAAMMDRLVAAWVRQWGDQPPRPPRAA